jgi:hypothetical protein
MSTSRPLVSRTPRKKSRVVGLASFVVAASLACSLAVTSPAAAMPPTCGTPGTTPCTALGPNVSYHDGWIQYTTNGYASLGLTNASEVTVQGTVDPDGGCDFTEADPDGVTATDASYEEELQFNPDTCQDELITGKIPASSDASLISPAAGTDTSDTVSETDPPDTGDSKHPDSANSTTYLSAHTKTSWVDPLDITITSMTANIKWPLFGDPGTISARNNSYKFAYDGWSVSGVPRPGIIRTYLYGGGWLAGGAETFRNNDFEDYVIDALGISGWASCGFTTATAVFKQHVDVYGYMDGARRSSWADSKSGGCADLVHHRTNNNWGWTS